MDWLTQNWIWILLVIGALFLFRRGHHGGFGGFGRGGHGHHGGSGGFGHGSGEHTGAPGYRQTQSDVPAAGIDPVSGTAVRVSDALTSVYQGRVYYFASKENRDRFEAAPEEYAAKAGSGEPFKTDTSSHHHRRHGC